jgi:hypothetical protein
MEHPQTQCQEGLLALQLWLPQGLCTAAFCSLESGRSCLIEGSNAREHLQQT